MEQVEEFERERPRLVGLAARVLGDPAEAEDVVQQAWLRLHGTDAQVDNLAGWLTTVVGRLCVDRLRVRRPDLQEPVDDVDTAPGPAEEVVLADAVGIALQVVLERLTPGERVALVLHDGFGYEFAAVAELLGTTPVAARKLASRARAKVRQPAVADVPADREVVDAFMAAARGGDLERLLALLAPDVVVEADAAAVSAGTPERIEGRDAVAAFFDGSAHAALPVLHGGRDGYAWYHRGRAMVLFDFEVDAGVVQRLTFRAQPAVLEAVVRRPARPAVTPPPSAPS